MKNVILYIVLLLSSSVYGQEAKKIGMKANQAYSNGNYATADSLYGESLRVSPAFNELVFNQGDALYRQGDFEGAAEKFESIAEKLSVKEEKAEAYHNLGNAHLSMQEFDKAAAAYRKSLINNPSDEDTRYNLAYAQKMLQKQQDENQDKQDQDKQDQQDQNKQNQDQQGQDENKQDQDQQSQDENKQDQDQQGQDENKQDGEQKDSQKQNQKPENGEDQKDQPQEQGNQGDNQQQKAGEPLKLSPEDAARILESIKQNEREIQAKLQRKKGKGKKVKIEKDW